MLGELLGCPSWHSFENPTTERENEMMTDDRKRFLLYMFTTALEGGIGYWSVAEEYHWSKIRPEAEHNYRRPDGTYTPVADVPQGHTVEDINGFFAVLSANDDDGNWGVDKAYQPRIAGDPIALDCGAGELTVDLKVMERGMNLFVDKVIEATKSEDPDAPFSRKYFRQAVTQWLSNGEDGDSDADVADLVVQLGLFGEVVYA
jgi:hypothetical protein